MLSSAQSGYWHNVHQISSYMLILALLVSFAALGVTLIANNRLTNDLDARTNAAATEAGKANEKIAALEKDAADSRSAQEALRLDNKSTASALEVEKSLLNEMASTAKSANDKVAGLEKDAAVAKAKRENLQLGSTATMSAMEAEKASRLDLQNEVAWREISPGTHASLVDNLSKVQASSIAIIYLGENAESHYYAREIGKTFKDSGWTVSYIAASYPSVLITYPGNGR
jgi:hypothetical protein